MSDYGHPPVLSVARVRSEPMSVVRETITPLTFSERSEMVGFKFSPYHWNRLEKGATVVVELSTSANVRLMDSSNFNAYKSGRNHRYYGGLITQSPFRITVQARGAGISPSTLSVCGPPTYATRRASYPRRFPWLNQPPPSRSARSDTSARPCCRTRTAKPGMCSSPMRAKTRKL